nr:GspH/FimT family pseudopilin [Methylotetracoccus oryzae]
MVTIAVAAIVLSLAVPSFRETIANNRTTLLANDLTADLTVARSEAIKRNAPVTVCKRNSDGTACNNGGTWNDGWLVFNDLDNDGVMDGGREGVLRLHDAVQGTLAVTFSRSRVTFDARGNAEGFNGTFKVCQGDLVRSARGRILSGTGRVKASRDSNGDGYHEDSSGDAFSCP